MIDLSPDTTRRWYSLLPPDFQEAVRPEVSEDVAPLDAVAAILNTATKGFEAQTFNEVCGYLPLLTKNERIRIISWFGAQTSYQAYTRLLTHINKLIEEDGESAGGSRMMFDDLDDLCEVIGLRMVSDPSVMVAIEIINDSVSNLYPDEPSFEHLS